MIKGFHVRAAIFYKKEITKRVILRGVNLNWPLLLQLSLTLFKKK